MRDDLLKDMHKLMVERNLAKSEVYRLHDVAAANQNAYNKQAWELKFDLAAHAQDKKTAEDERKKAQEFAEDKATEADCLAVRLALAEAERDEREQAAAEADRRRAAAEEALAQVTPHCICQYTCDDYMIVNQQSVVLS